VLEGTLPRKFAWKLTTRPALPRATQLPAPWVSFEYVFERLIESGAVIDVRSETTHTVAANTVKTLRALTHDCGHLPPQRHDIGSAPGARSV
jgi:hypothetical protein